MLPNQRWVVSMAVQAVVTVRVAEDVSPDATELVNTHAMVVSIHVQVRAKTLVATLAAIPRLANLCSLVVA